MDSINQTHWTDDEGNPAGGCSYAPGICVSWQNGALPRNGAFVDDLIRIAMGRLKYYESGKFASEYNVQAIAHLEAVLELLGERMRERESRGVAGKMEL